MLGRLRVGFHHGLDVASVIARLGVPAGRLCRTDPRGHAEAGASPRQAGTDMHNCGRMRPCGVHFSQTPHRRVHLAVESRTRGVNRGRSGIHVLRHDSQRHFARRR